MIMILAGSEVRSGSPACIDQVLEPNLVRLCVEDQSVSSDDSEYLLSYFADDGSYSLWTGFSVL